MHPGIGSSRSIEPDPASAVEAAQGPFDLTLDGAFPRLGLEAAELRSVVFDPCGEPPGPALSSGWLGRRCRRTCVRRSRRFLRRARAGPLVQRRRCELRS
jgi:hypothetical protein